MSIARNRPVRKKNAVSLPPIAVEQQTENLALLLPVELKHRMEDFAAIFAHTTGGMPTSLNAVAVGILTGYLADHRAFQQWAKARQRGAEDTRAGDTRP